METLPRRGETPGTGTYGPQESRILHDDKDAFTSTGKMGGICGELPFPDQISVGKEGYEARRVVSTSGLR